MKKTLLFLFLIALSSMSFAINPDAVDSINVKIKRSGSLEPMGSISSASLMLYMPQGGVKSIDVNGAEWSYGYDEFGNKIINLTWKTINEEVFYTIDIEADNAARHLYSEKAIGSNLNYVNDTLPKIKEMAYPYEKSLKKITELSKLVHDYITYDKSFAGRQQSVAWILENKRGVCAEYARMLVSLLHANEIPARYVNGYTYSESDGKLIGHTWVQVLMEDGSWAEFDPTWLEGGYIDATHIRTAYLPDPNQTEILVYTGTASLKWKQNEDDVTIIQYSSKNTTEILAKPASFGINAYGFVDADISSNECQMARISAISCLMDNDHDMLKIISPDRIEWICKDTKLYWPFYTENLDSDYKYTCPVSVYTQQGARSDVNISLENTKNNNDAYITGPETVQINEEFSLSHNKGGTFFSPNITGTGENPWRISLQKPGAYEFYLFSGNSSAKKTVNAVERKQFNVVFTLPTNATVGKSFIIEVAAMNLASEQKTATLRFEIDGQRYERALSFLPNEIKKVEFNITANTPGIKAATASILYDSIYVYSEQITAYEIQKPDGFFDWIIYFFQSLFK